MKKKISLFELPILIKKPDSKDGASHIAWNFIVDPDASVYNELFSTESLGSILYSKLLPLDMRLILRLKGDFITSIRDNRCLDGNFLKGTLPSGNGSEGGLFESWIRLTLNPQNGVFGEYFKGSNFEEFVSCNVIPEVNLDETMASSRLSDNEMAMMKMVLNQAAGISARWLGKVTPRYSETYTFTVISQGGVRLWVDNKLIINAWTEPQSKVELMGTSNLNANQTYDIKLEYNGSKANSTIQLLWSSSSQKQEAVPQICLTIPQGLFGEYRTGEIHNELKLVRVDDDISFDWNANPDSAVPSTNLYATWVGLISPEQSGNYKFYLTSGDGSKLTIDKIVLIDNLKGATQPEMASAKAISLIAGKLYPIGIQYYKNQGPGSITLSWSNTTLSKQVVPDSCLFPPMSYRLADNPDVPRE